MRELVAGWIDEVNAELAQVETIKRFALIAKELDHEDGELTATQKVKRAAHRARVRRCHRGALRGGRESHRVTEFLQLCFAGLALGARYALVALGFVIIYRRPASSTSRRAACWPSAPT